MGRGTWGSVANGVAQGQTKLKQFTTHTHNPCLYHYLEHSGDILLCTHVLIQNGGKIDQKGSAEKAAGRTPS